MIEAVMFWDEPNNKSRWDSVELDPDWNLFAEMVNLASDAVRRANPKVVQVLGGMSPIDPNFIVNMAARGVVARMDAVAVHGFPLDWNDWKIDEWPQKIGEIGAVAGKPVWVSGVGASTFGADEVQVFGIDRTAKLLIGRTPRIHWDSLYDRPAAPPATTRNREAEDSAFSRRFHLGLLREDGSMKPALERFAVYSPEIGICQWFHFEDPRLSDAVAWLRRLGVRHLRTGLSWADRLRPNALDWFDRQMEALADFQTTITFCSTPESLGMAPHAASPPRRLEGYAEFCEEMVRRYAPAKPLRVPRSAVLELAGE